MLEPVKCKKIPWVTASCSSTGYIYILYIYIHHHVPLEWKSAGISWKEKQELGFELPNLLHWNPQDLEYSSGNQGEISWIGVRDLCGYHRQVYQFGGIRFGHLRLVIVMGWPDTYSTCIVWSHAVLRTVYCFQNLYKICLKTMQTPIQKIHISISTILNQRKKNTAT